MSEIVQPANIGLEQIVAAARELRARLQEGAVRELTIEANPHKVVWLEVWLEPAAFVKSFGYPASMEKIGTSLRLSFVRDGIRYHTFVLADASLFQDAARELLRRDMAELARLSGERERAGTT